MSPITCSRWRIAAAERASQSMPSDLYFTCSLQAKPGLSGRAADGLECRKAEEMVDSHWRLRRAWTIEARMVEDRAGTQISPDPLDRMTLLGISPPSPPSATSPLPSPPSPQLSRHGGGTCSSTRAYFHCRTLGWHCPEIFDNSRLIVSSDLSQRNCTEARRRIQPLVDAATYPA